MSESFWLAVGFVLFIEGLGPLLVPQQWRQMLQEISQQHDGHLRRYGGALVVAGAVIIAMLWH